MCRFVGLETRVEGTAPPAIWPLASDYVDAYSYCFAKTQVELQSSVAEQQAAMAALFAEDAARAANQIRLRHLKNMDLRGLKGLTAPSRVPAQTCAEWPRNAWHLGKVIGSEQTFSWEAYNLSATVEVGSPVTTTSSATDSYPVRRIATVLLHFAEVLPLLQPGLPVHVQCQRCRWLLPLSWLCAS